jgi:hypothetical protein
MCHSSEFFLVISDSVDETGRSMQYHYRLYILDSQVRHLDDLSLMGFRCWVFRKWMKCQERKREVVSELGRLKISEDVLHSEWAAQVKEQTKPMKSESLPSLFGLCIDRFMCKF